MKENSYQTEVFKYYHRHFQNLFLYHYLIHWHPSGYLLKRGTTWNYLQQARSELKRPEQPTMAWTYLQREKKDAKRPITGRFWDYFPPTIWLQSFEHCFTENHGENRVSSTYYYASSVNCHVYFLRDIRFIFLCLCFVSAGKRRGYFFSSSLPLPPASPIRLVFSVCIYPRGLLMKEFGTVLHFLLSKPL